MRKAFLLAILLLLALLLPIALANVLTTTMTWFVPSAKSHSISYGGNCSQTAFFFPENQAVADNDVDGNALKMLPFPNRNSGSACQSASLAGMVITNSGNITENIDANFVAALDTNVWLKVWMGYGSPQGCGTGGLGGWSVICPVASTTAAVTQTTCKDFNAGNATVGSRLVTNLPAGDTNQLCFSGDFLPNLGTNGFITGAGPQIPAGVTQGDHNATFQTNPDFS